MSELQQFLEDLGLSDTEAQLYLGTVGKGQLTVAQAGRYSGVKRTTAHSNIESLIEKGFLSQITVDGKRRIKAEDPEKVLDLVLSKRLTDAKKLEKQLPVVLKELQSKSEKGQVKEAPNTARQYIGKTGVQLVYDNIFHSGELRAYLSAELDELFPENSEMFARVVEQNRNIRIKEILQDSKVNREYAEKMPKDKYDYKFIPKNVNLRIPDYIMYDGNVAIIGANNQKEPYALVIQNDRYYETECQIFDYIWETLT